MPLPNIGKHVFPGSNTPSGFHSYYTNIIPSENANKIFIIKGGPGTGKSSFMKKVAKHFSAQKIEIEYHHCSADPNSLDAIVIVPAKVAIIDGTFPHAIDPSTPGAIDEIINFAPFWNEKEIRSNKAQITETNAKRKFLFAKSYSYLRAAKEVYDAYALSEQSTLDKEAFFKMENSILTYIFNQHKLLQDQPSSFPGTSRHLFGSAITPDGFVDHLHTIIGKVTHIYTIKDAPGASAKNLMALIADMAIRLGFYVECFHSPISPDTIDDLIIPKLDLAITVANHYHKAKVIPSQIFDLKGCRIASQLAAKSSDLERDKALIDDLFNLAIASLAQAKAQHNILESYYIPHVRFDEMDPMIDHVIRQIDAFL